MQEQTALFQTLPDPMASVTFYRSGANSMKDFAGLARAQVPIGVSALGLSVSRGQQMLQHAASAGSALFVDSGAFTAFGQGRTLDFARQVFPVYEGMIRTLTSLSGAARVMLTAPDVIGDQAATFCALGQHRQRLQQYMRSGAKLLVPLPHGQLAPGDAYRRIVHLLESDDFVLGVPSQREAYSVLDLERLLSAVQPRRLHLLGIGAARHRLIPRLSLIRRLAPECELSIDANRIRAYLGRGRRLTDGAHARASLFSGWECAAERPPETDPSEWVDETECMGDIGMGLLSPGELRQLLTHLGLEGDRGAVTAHARGELAQYLETHLPDPRLLDMAVHRMKTPMSYSQARTEEIAAMASEGLL